VSLSPSTTRPFDAPEFILTLRCRHPARGHSFCPRVLYSLNPPLWLISGTLQLPVSWCCIGLPRRKRGLGIGFLSLSEGCYSLCEDRSRFFLSIIPYPLVAILSCLPAQEPTRRGQLSGNSPLSGYLSVSRLNPLGMCTPQRPTLYYRSSLPFSGPFLIRRRCRAWPHHLRFSRPEFGN
jgi:hypothetical protein